jgi:1-phosphatidylinositol phosphodiesterase
LKSLERFEDPNTQQSRPSAFSFASNTATSLAPTAPRLGEHADTFIRQDLDVELLPFESYTLKTLDPELDAKEIAPGIESLLLRLTIETPTKERHRIDTNPSYTQKASHAFTPLSPKPSTSFTALYHPSNTDSAPSPHVTIHANHLHNLSSWMSDLPSSLPLSALSIPGTHNSHTHYRALPSVRCQSVPVRTQLENGIRFVDIRVQPASSGKDLYLVHGAFPVSLMGAKLLEPVLTNCYEFLGKNPGETILISLKREGTGSGTDEQLSQILEQHYIGPNASKWYTQSSIPYLKDVRGKMVLVRRYNLHSTSLPSPSPHLHSSDPNAGFGLDATTWPYNTTNHHHPPFVIQDFCEVLHPSNIPAKLQYSNEHLERSSSCTHFIPGVNTDATNPLPAEPIYLNFATGSNFWNPGCWPDRIAKVINRGLEEWIVRGHHLISPPTTPGNPGTTDVVIRGGEDESRKAKEGDGGTGIVVMDFVGVGGDWDLVRLIVGLNMGVLSRCTDLTA